MKKIISGVDFAILFSADSIDQNINFFLGNEVRYGCMVLDSKPVLFVPGFEYHRIKKLVKDINVNLSKKGLFKKIRKEYKGKKVGVNFSSLTLAEFNKIKKEFSGCKFVDISDKLRKLRLQKKRSEIKSIKKACKITDDIFSLLVKEVGSFKTELDIEKFLRKQFIEHDVRPSFDPIVACSKNAYFPHHEADNTKLKGFCVIDFGVKYDNYCSDMTRTLYFGKPTKKEIEIYNTVLSCQKSLIKKAKPNTFIADLQSSAVGMLGQYGKHLVHSVGHSIGVEVHDPMPKQMIKLLKNMVFTIEPGVYIKGKLGIRIEDDILVKDKVEVLTKSPKDFIAVQKKG